jgi:hypothetical protein
MSDIVHAYKLFRQRNDGTLGSLFFARRSVIPIGRWIDSYAITKPGYAFRPGWHCTAAPVAPHLYSKKEKRVWGRVELQNATELWRPGVQGGLWYIADKMRVVSVLP